MKLQDIFAKDIDRQIDGVIKADDDSHLISEVEEYVLTDELKKHLDLFLDAYNNSKSFQWCLDLGFLWFW